MAPEEERRGSPESGKGDFDGRDLLIGRPEGGAGRPTAGAAGTSQEPTSPHPDAHDDVIREILETVRATAARIDALENAPGPADETAEALAREMAALTQAVEDARGALAKAAELAARRDGQASAGARALAEGAAALKTQGEALDKRLRAAGRQPGPSRPRGRAMPRQRRTVRCRLSRGCSAWSCSGARARLPGQCRHGRMRLCRCQREAAGRCRPAKSRGSTLLLSAAAVDELIQGAHLSRWRARCISALSRSCSRKRSGRLAQWGALDRVRYSGTFLTIPSRSQSLCGQVCGYERKEYIKSSYYQYV